jgi:hypothetical protein
VLFLEASLEVTSHAGARIVPAGLSAFVYLKSAAGTTVLIGCLAGEAAVRMCPAVSG